MVFGGHQAILFCMAPPPPNPPKTQTHTPPPPPPPPPEMLHFLFFCVFKTVKAFMGSSINNQECYQVFLNLVKHELLVYCDLFLELSLLVLFMSIRKS